MATPSKSKPKSGKPKAEKQPTERAEERRRRSLAAADLRARAGKNMVFGAVAAIVGAVLTMWSNRGVGDIGLSVTQIIYWALILGADFGGNATYLGSAPNIVAVGLLAQAGVRLSFKRFVRDGVPVTLVTLVIATIWLLVRY